MRKIVAYEGRESKEPIPRFIEDSALYVVDEEIPVTIYKPGFSEKIGTASGFLREEFGSISFEINTDYPELLVDRHPAIFLSNTACKFENGVHFFIEGVIREIQFHRGVNAWGE